jgi:hypothetical protein
VGNAPEVVKTIGDAFGKVIVAVTTQGVAIVRVTVSAEYPDSNKPPTAVAPVNVTKPLLI